MSSLLRPLILIGKFTDIDPYIDFVDHEEKRVLTYPSFGIDDSHVLIKLLSEVPEHTLLIIKMNSITNEAQNALLKSTEEIRSDLGLVLVLSTDQQLLDTLKSRFDIKYIEDNTDGNKSLSAKSFLSKNIPDRLKYIEKNVSHPKESEAEESRVVFQRFCKDLYLELRNREDQEVMKVLDALTRYQAMTAPSYRLLYENLALILPTSK